MRDFAPRGCHNVYPLTLGGILRTCSSLCKTKLEVLGGRGRGVANRAFTSWREKAISDSCSSSQMKCGASNSKSRRTSWCLSSILKRHANHQETDVQCLANPQWMKSWEVEVLFCFRFRFATPSSRLTCRVSGSWQSGQVGSRQRQIPAPQH